MRRSDEITYYHCIPESEELELLGPLFLISSKTLRSVCFKNTEMGPVAKFWKIEFWDGLSFLKDLETKLSLNKTYFLHDALTIIPELHLMLFKHAH